MNAVEAVRPLPEPTSDPDLQSVQPQGAAPLVFLHIPKTAGTSLTTMLRNAYGDSRILHLRMEDAGVQERIADALTSRRWSCLTGHLPYYLFAQSHRRARFFSVLRDPIDRVVSLCRFLERHSLEERRNHGLGQGPVIDQVLRTRNPGLFAQVNNGMCRILANDHRLFNHRSVFFWKHPESRLLEDAMSTLSEIDFGLQEDMPATFALARRLGGLSPSQTHYHENALDRADAPLSAEHLRQIAELNATDIALYRAARVVYGKRLAKLPDDPDRPDQTVAFMLDHEIKAADLPGREGFHAHEPEGLAWVIAGQPARLRLRTTQRPGALDLRLYCVLPDFPVQETTVLVDGDCATQAIISRDGCWVTMRVGLSAPQGQLIELSLVPPYSLPARFLHPDTADERYLSFALGSVTLRA